MWHQPLIQGKVKEDFNCELAELASYATWGGILHTISSHVPTSPETTIKFNVLIKSYDIK